MRNMSKATMSVVFVLMAVSATAEERTIKMYVENRTSYNFVDGQVTNHQQVNIHSVPTTVNAGKENYIDFHYDKSTADAVHMDVHYTVDSDNGEQIAVKFKYDGSSFQCHTDVPSDLRSEIQDCDQEQILYYFYNN